VPPPDLDALRTLAANHRWTWDVPTRRLLDQLPGAEPDRHPVASIERLDHEQLLAWIDDHRAEIDACHRGLLQLLADSPQPVVAYLSPEFGIAAAVRQYSGGLGILAGDHLKAASDLGVPLVGIGLFYREGFFRQQIDRNGQTERYQATRPEAFGAVDTGTVVDVPVTGETVYARVWQLMVGRTRLLLLDTDIPANGSRARKITDRLYSGDRRHRLEQELVLGVGGVRALRALTVDPEVFHLNEGHACFGLLELLAERRRAGSPLPAAIEAVRSQTLFTTHTPVPAGIDRFEQRLVGPALEPWAEELGVTVAEVIDWAHLPSDGPKAPFNTAALAIELCGRANGVSQLHASVSRKLFASLPRARRIEGITNGVHARTWVDPDLQSLYDHQLGPGWDNGDPEAWSRVARIDREEFRRIRHRGRRALADLVAERTGTPLDGEGCIIGFARRFATYKRAALLLRDRTGLAASFEAGARFVFAGKAHPADDEGKAVLAELAAFADSARGRGRIVLVPDYDIGVARALYAGCDVWLNNPVRPREASGTSGEKAALNGVLNCSILDGWWADWYLDGIGWAIPTSDADVESERDDEEAVAIHRVLVDDVLPVVADPVRCWTMTSAMLAHLGPKVTAGRMVAEYDRRFYRPIRDGR